MKELFLLAGFVIGIAGASMFNLNQYLEIETKITQHMKEHPTKYHDDYSFGYSIGLIACSQIVHNVLRK